MEADVGGVGQAGIDQGPVEPAAGIVADGHRQRVGGVTQRRTGGRTGGDQEDVLLRHLRPSHHFKGAGTGRRRGCSAADAAPDGQPPQCFSISATRFVPVEIAGRPRRDVRGDVTAIEIGLHLVARQSAVCSAPSPGCCCPADGRRSKCAWHGRRPTTSADRRTCRSLR